MILIEKYVKDRKFSRTFEIFFFFFFFLLNLFQWILSFYQEKNFRRQIVELDTKIICIFYIVTLITSVNIKKKTLIIYHNI